jgi:4-hydroxybenzoate polyprenyltransferase
MKMSNKTPIKKFIALIRIWDWWNQVHIVFVSALILLLFTQNPSQYLASLIVLGLYMFFLGAYGYVLNSYTDRDQDIKIGKHPEVSYYSKRQHLFILLFFAVGAFGIPLIYESDAVKLVGVVTFFLATFYSARPLRLKERGVLGPMACTLSQRPLSYLFFMLIISDTSLLAWFLFCFMVLSGFVVELGHQLLDYENDRKANVRTWALSVGFTRFRNLIILIQAFIFVYMCLPPFLFGVINGTAITFILIVFYKDVLMYLIRVLKTPGGTA